MTFRFLKYFPVFLTLATVYVSLQLGGIFVFFSLVYAFVLIPLLELISPASAENMSKTEEEVAKKDIKFDLIVWSMVPIQYLLLAFFLYKVSNPLLQPYEIVGNIIAFGISCSVLGINVAHELGHRANKVEQFMAKSLLLTSLYMHFFIEHNRGHHKNVSTDDDPASAKYGESLYAFLFRSIRDGWLSAWHLESVRLKKVGKSPFSIHNEMLWYQIVQGLLIVAIALVFGWKVMLYFIAAAAFGFSLLETVNYIEHYGLRRKKIDGEYYDKVMPIHSWNSNHAIGRIMLFELTRHSDHHYMASRKYQILRHFDQSPQMPTGYPGMMVLAMFPPLFFKVMHRTIAKYRATEAGLALG